MFKIVSIFSFLSCSFNTGQLVGRVTQKINLTFRYKTISTMAAESIKQRYDNIIKSPEDKRVFCGLELQNGLKILLISDTTTDKSAAAMDVNIGSMSDPDHLPGLAHFCEHMLFLGTEKYPEENEYSKFLNEHGGMSNAFTSGEHTNYFFDVSAEYLHGALDRFSQFFLQPLFTATATEREVNAVNSENDKNLQQDVWRLHQLDKSTCKPDHAFSKFATGNKDTLDTLPSQKGIDVRAELLDFHKCFYSSNIMALSVLGKEPVEELIDMVVPMFAHVQNKNTAVPEWLSHPYGPEQLQTIIKAVPVKDIRSLVLCWAVPDLHQYYKHGPGHYVAHLIGHEGPGSLLSELKRRGWVNNLVGGEKEAAKGFGFFMVSVDLTEDGIENTDEIITLTYQHLKMLREKGCQQWIFDECRDLNAMSFRFRDKELPRNITSRCSSVLHDYPITEVLSAGFLLEDFRPDLVQQLLDKLVPDNMRVLVVGKKFSGNTDRVEHWYGTQYSLDRIPDSVIQKLAAVELHPNLVLPLRNEFVPTNFDLVPRETEISSLPVAIRESNFSLVWCKQDNEFLLPKVHVSIEMTSPYAYMDPFSTNLAHLFVILCKDALNEYTYDAELAGLSYELTSSVYGLVLSVNGYHDKLHILLQKIVDKMTTFRIDSQRFEILKEEYIRGLKNFKAELPYQHAVYFTTVIVSEQVWTKSELLDATEEMTVAKLEAFIPQLLSKLHLEYLIDGNVTKQTALQLADIVEERLRANAQSRPLLASQHRRMRELQLPDGCYYLYRVSNEVHRSSSLEVYLQCGMQETNSNMLLELYNQIINEPCFNILRTKEQLGYIVASGVRRACGVQGLRIIVQSDRSSDYVEQRVEAFLLTMKSHLEEMTEEAFNKHVEALASKISEKPKRLGAQHSKYWVEIITQQYNFDRDNIEVAHLLTLKKEHIVQFHTELIAHDAPKRHKLSVHVIPTGTATSVSAAGPNIADDGDVADEELQEVEMQVHQVPPSITPDTLDGLAKPPVLLQPDEITELSGFKKQLGLFPLPKPYINIASSKAKL